MILGPQKYAKLKEMIKWKLTWKLLIQLATKKISILLIKFRPKDFQNQIYPSFRSLGVTLNNFHLTQLVSYASF